MVLFFHPCNLPLPLKTSKQELLPNVKDILLVIVLLLKVKVNCYSCVSTLSPAS